MPEARVPDYLVIGGGATSLAFVDGIVSHSDATVTIVDGHDRPGGHCNEAYPFVRLPQPGPADHCLRVVEARR